MDSMVPNRNRCDTLPCHSVWSTPSADSILTRLSVFVWSGVELLLYYSVNRCVCVADTCFFRKWWESNPNMTNSLMHPSSSSGKESTSDKNTERQSIVVTKRVHGTTSRVESVCGEYSKKEEEEKKKKKRWNVLCILNWSLIDLTWNWITQSRRWMKFTVTVYSSL